MPAILRLAGTAAGGRRLRRSRIVFGNWWRLILSAALIATGLTALLTGTLPPLPLPIVSVAHRASLVRSLNSKSSSGGSSPSLSIENSDKTLKGLFVKACALLGLFYSSTVIKFMIMDIKRSDSGYKIADSTRPEMHVKEVVSTNNSTKLEKDMKDAKPSTVGQKVAFWSLTPDKALLHAKREIDQAPLVIDDPDLYAPIFRNLSFFKRSYELMERILKVYIYPDGSRPIFHTPELQGIYASEGWFMKLMEENQRFVVTDPEKAHLFYMPYSSRQLRDVVYKPGSHNIRPLAIFLRDYVNNISSKYPFWNRTRGSDHFLVACHDWGPYSTTLHAELCKNTIKALCNADSSENIFIHGKDVSLPETNIKVPKHPHKYVGGGKRVSQRPILAFYAGLMHGRVRPTLEKLWGNDTEGDMRIFRRLPNRVSRNMSYVEHMKSSRFCICPMGYEVNSPRIVEAIYYECVPVIIADNFVLPFEQVLNWSTFSVVVAEKNIADLKNILLAIPLRRYLKMLECVKRVQKHFVWHSRPEKYDLFHIILHSIWLSRLNQIHAPP